MDGALTLAFKRHAHDATDSRLRSAPAPRGFESRRDGLAHAQHGEEVGLEQPPRDSLAEVSRVWDGKPGSLEIDDDLALCAARFDLGRGFVG